MTWRSPIKYIVLEINQSRYALYILKKYNMLNCNPSKNLVSPCSKLSREEGELLQDVTSYRSFVCSNLTYAINQVAQFVQEPRTCHLMIAKRILRYIIKSKLNHGLFFLEMIIARKFMISLMLILVLTWILELKIHHWIMCLCRGEI